MWDCLISPSNPVSFCFMNFFFYFLKNKFVEVQFMYHKIYLFSAKKIYIYIYIFFFFFADLLDCATMTIIQF